MLQWVHKISLSTLVVLYLAVVFKPLWPCADYLLRQDYFATVLCVNQDRPELKCEGKCVLMQKIQAAQEIPTDECPLQVEVEDFVSLVFWESSSANSLATLLHSVPATRDALPHSVQQPGPLTPPPRS